MLEVMPRLPPGVIIHFHDITWPFDYPQEIFDRYYSEQYLLGAYLLAKGQRIKPILTNYFISQDPELSSLAGKIWSDPAFDGIDKTGSSFWAELG